MGLRHGGRSARHPATGFRPLPTQRRLTASGADRGRRPTLPMPRARFAWRSPATPAAGTPARPAPQAIRPDGGLAAAVRAGRASPGQRPACLPLHRRPHQHRLDQNRWRPLRPCSPRLGRCPSTRRWGRRRRTDGGGSVTSATLTAFNPLRSGRRQPDNPNNRHPGDHPEGGALAVRTTRSTPPGPTDGARDRDRQLLRFAAGERLAGRTRTSRSSRGCSELADARACGVPTIVTGNRNLNPTFTPKLNVANDGGPRPTCWPTAGRAPTYSTARERTARTIPQRRANTIPEFGTGTLGYGSQISAWSAAPAVRSSATAA